MKIRFGFVSNSSASSFIIQWKFNGWSEFGDRADTPYAVLFDLMCYLEESKEPFDWIDSLESYDQKWKNIIQEIADNTVCLSETSNLYETNFFTNMRNSILDYGEAAMVFLMALNIDKAENGLRNFEIIHMKTDDF